MAEERLELPQEPRKVLLLLAGLLAIGLPLPFGLVHTASVQAWVSPLTQQTGIEGTWQGTIHLPDSTLRTVLKIERTPAGALRATMYFVDQGRQPIAASSVSFEGGTLRFVNQFPGLTYEAKMSTDGNSMSGTVQQNSSFPLVLERATPETEWAIPAPPAKMPAMAADAMPGVEVATIKPTAPDAPRTMLTFCGSEIVISRMTLNDLIEFSYNLHEKQILNGPGWMGTEKFDIKTRPDQPGSPNGEQFRMVLKKLLADRFALGFHSAQREMSAYVLRVGKDGPKMTKSAEPAGRPVYSEGPGGLIRMRNATMGDFAALMQSTVLDRPVVDRTGLEGRWEFVLKWMPDETQFGGQVKLPSTSDAADNPPPLFTAIQEQLGLKIETQKTTVDVMVIDHVDHPSPN
jgi:uncharacterized protein (TIGR03435 family)